MYGKHEHTKHKRWGQVLRRCKHTKLTSRMWAFYIYHANGVHRSQNFAWKKRSNNMHETRQTTFNPINCKKDQYNDNGICVKLLQTRPLK